MIGYAINVGTRELTRALKRLQRTEKTAPLVYLRYVTGKLTITLGQTSEELTIEEGIWPGSVSAPAKWVRALATHPNNAAITDLRVHDGKLCARDFSVICNVNEGEEVAKEVIVRRKAKRAGQ